MDESSFWSNRIRPLIFQAGGWAERIENGLAAGTPDVHYVTGRGRGIPSVGERVTAGWIELKYCDKPPARSQTVVFNKHHGLREGQVPWWRMYLHHGGVGLIVAGIGSAQFAFRATDSLVQQFNTFTMREITLYGRSFNTVNNVGALLAAQE